MNENFAELVAKAEAAGMEAGSKMTPRPMVVGTPTTLFGNDIDRTKPMDFVSDGVCGFAWIKFKGNTPFARWMKKNRKVRAGYPKGLEVNVSAFGQSMQRKEAYARAYAKVLNDAGIEAYADSRMD